MQQVPVILQRIAVLLTVHNRKERTLECLTRFYAAVQHLRSTTVFDVYLTDDGSSDGTWAAVGTAFPQVHLIRGNGTLFWCRGMISSWKQAVACGDYDGFLWLNNDSYLYPEALNVMYDAIRCAGDGAIVSGAFADKTGKATYGGRIKNKILTPNGQLQEFSQLNGNFVFISKAVFQRVGFLDATWQHAIGDFDYGLRAAKNGIRLYLTPCFVGVCERNEKPVYHDPKYPVAKRLRYLYSPLGPPPFTLFKFHCRHHSLFTALVVVIYNHIVCLFPCIKTWMRKNK